MKIALIQDQLLTSAGSERMFLYLSEEFREADLYTLAYNADTTWPEFRNFSINTHWFNRLIRDHHRFKTLFPLTSLAMENWDFSNYDVIVTSSATTAKYLKKFRGLHICYCYYPTRAIWTFDRYFGGRLGIKERLFSLLLPYFKMRDLEAAGRVNEFIAISESSRSAIREYYSRDAKVLLCPVDLIRFNAAVTSNKKDYFLLVSRLESWKMVDYAIEAFNKLGLPLRIIGTGPEGARLRDQANSNITFLGGVDDETLARSYGEARAVIFTPELEYGLVPIEALATGTPVIALGRGGVMETMVGLDDPAGRPPTAVLFDEPTADCLINAVRLFERSSFDVNDLLAHARSFGIPIFKKRFRAMIEDCVATAFSRENGRGGKISA